MFQAFPETVRHDSITTSMSSQQSLDIYGLANADKAKDSGSGVWNSGCNQPDKSNASSFSHQIYGQSSMLQALSSARETP